MTSPRVPEVHHKFRSTGISEIVLTFHKLTGTLIQKDTAAPDNRLRHSIKRLLPFIHLIMQLLVLDSGIGKSQRFTLI